MLVEAVNWPPERNLSPDRIFSAPELAYYVTGWPRHGDLGVVAEGSERPVGAAWLRFFPVTDPGYGFVGADVPELSIGVAAPWRGRAWDGRSCGPSLTRHVQQASGRLVSASGGGTTRTACTSTRITRSWTQAMLRRTP